MTRRRIGARIGLVVGLMGTGVLLAGCLSPKKDPTRFYVLSNSDAAQVDEAWDDRPGSIDVGVGPFTMPGYLDRPQFVRRTGPNELELVEAPAAEEGEGGEARWVRLQAGLYTTALDSGVEDSEGNSETIRRAETINGRTSGWAYRIPDYKFDAMNKRMADLVQAIEPES